jgi:hypothetical protein
MVRLGRWEGVDARAEKRGFGPLHSSMDVMAPKSNELLPGRGGEEKAEELSENSLSDRLRLSKGIVLQAKIGGAREKLGVRANAVVRCFGSNVYSSWCRNGFDSDMQDSVDAVVGQFASFVLVTTGCT